MVPSTGKLVDVVVGTLAACVLVAAALPMLAADRDRSRRGKDAAQIRQLHVALTTWAGSHAGDFPLPSAIDTANGTVSASATTRRNKDNTGNLFSIMIFNGLLSPEMTVSPVESSSVISVDSGYEYASPSHAASPSQALWDPGYAGTRSDAPAQRRQPGIGNCSYAHLIPLRQRQAQWSNAALPGVVLAGNRGPQYDGSNSVDEANYPPGNVGWTLFVSAVGTGSNTLLFYPPRNTWAGHYLQADGRVTFSTRSDPSALRYRLAITGQPRVVPDNLFVNENDEATRPPVGSQAFDGTNAYLRQISNITGPDTLNTVTIFRD